MFLKKKKKRDHFLWYFLHTKNWNGSHIPFCVSLCLRVDFNLNIATAFEPFPQKWDPVLKVLAEGYAAKCVWNHNPDLEDTGENLFAATGPMDLREGLEKWFLGECRIWTSCLLVIQVFFESTNHL